ncbi:MAG: bacteriocin family protein, partial [Tissierellia bacterium]|nr:bacteriocin family protein [Tissierellia bacterium]
MDFLFREDSPISAELWAQIDKEVTSMAKKVLVGRRFLHLYGPLGAGVQSINIDDLSQLEEREGSIATIKGRKFLQLPLLNQDFSLLWRDLEHSKKTGMPVDLSSALQASAAIARKEDDLIFNGNKELGYEGLLTAEGTTKLPLSNWEEGENPVKDITSGISKLLEKQLVGKYALVISTDLLVKLQRIQPGTGVTEYERLSKLVGGNIYHTTVMGTNKAVLVCPEPQNMDLAVGQDMLTSYLEDKDLNHYFRIIETILLRIKNKNAIVVYE